MVCKTKDNGNWMGLNDTLDLGSAVLQLIAHNVPRSESIFDKTGPLWLLIFLQCSFLGCRVNTECGDLLWINFFGSVGRGSEGYSVQRREVYERGVAVGGADSGGARADDGGGIESSVARMERTTWGVTGKGIVATGAEAGCWAWQEAAPGRRTRWRVKPSEIWGATHSLFATTFRMPIPSRTEWMVSWPVLARRRLAHSSNGVANSIRSQSTLWVPGGWSWSNSCPIRIQVRLCLGSKFCRSMMIDFPSFKDLLAMASHAWRLPKTSWQIRTKLGSEFSSWVAKVDFPLPTHPDRTSILGGLSGVRSGWLRSAMSDVWRWMEKAGVTVGAGPPRQPWSAAGVRPKCSTPSSRRGQLPGRPIGTDPG